MFIDLSITIVDSLIDPIFIKKTNIMIILLVMWRIINSNKMIGLPTNQ